MSKTGFLCFALASYRLYKNDQTPAVTFMQQIFPSIYLSINQSFRVSVSLSVSLVSIKACVVCTTANQPTA